MMLGREQKQHIRAIFLAPVESYTLSEVVRLTGLSRDSLRREVAAGDRDAVKVGRAWRFTWRQLVCIALDRWTWGEIHDALGPDAATALPPLLALHTVTV